MSCTAINYVECSSFSASRHIFTWVKRKISGACDMASCFQMKTKGRGRGGGSVPVLTTIIISQTLIVHSERYEKQ